MSDRAFALLLLCYPSAFRRQFGSDMSATFRARLTEVSRTGGSLGVFWLRTIRDALAFGLAERIRPRRQEPVARSGTRPRRVAIVSSAGAELRLALRTLRRRPALSTVAVVALALGIGVTTATFSITHATILRGLPFERADQLVHFERVRPEDGQLAVAVTPHDYLAWRERQQSFEDLGAYVEALIHLTGPDGYVERLWGVYINPVSFRLLRARPLLGRVFTEEESAPGGADVIVLSHRLWMSRFEGDSTIVGRAIPINGSSSTVIGVMPEGFGFPIAEEFWRPLRIDLAQTARGEGRLDVFGRLRPGASLETARAEFATISASLATAYPETNSGIRATLKTFREEYVGDEFTRSVYAMLLAAALVLAIACANVASVLVARVMARRKEVAVRRALGASRGRLVSQLLLEAFVLSSIGAAAGLLIAAIGVSWFAECARAGVLQLPHGGDSLFWWDIRLDSVSVAFVLGIALLTTAVAGAVPALYAARTPITRALNDESKGSSSRVLALFSRGLVVSQIALTASLLMAAGLAFRSVVNLAQISERVESDGILTIRVALPLGQTGVPEERYPDHRARLQFFDRVIDELQARPEVRSVAVGSVLPTVGGRVAPMAVEGRAYATDLERPEVRVATVSPGFLETFGIAMLEGRSFTERDDSLAEPVAIINASLARRHFRNRSPLHARLRIGTDADEPWVRIVGVVPDSWSSRDASEDLSRVFVPLAQSGTPNPTVRLGPWGLRYMTVAARGSMGVPPAETIRRTIATVDPEIPLYRIRTMDDAIVADTGQYRLYGRYYLAFALAALTLALVGVYGVMSFSVGRRRAEFGIRMALGASGRAVIRSVLRQVAAQIGVGLLLGGAVAAWLAQGLREALFRVQIWDPAVLIAVPLMLIVTGVIAGLAPALRAARVDPTEAMRPDR